MHTTAPKRIRTTLGFVLNIKHAYSDDNIFLQLVIYIRGRHRVRW